MVKSTDIQAATQPPSSILTMNDLAASVSLDPTGATPLHLQLEHALRALLQQGRLRPGAALPGEMELVRALGVSRHTVRHALSALVADGLLSRRRGSGTTVSATGADALIERSLGSFYAFAWEVRSRGAEHRSEILERQTLAAPQAVAERLKVRPGSPVERIVRVRRADGEPLVLETAYLPGDLGCLLDADALEREAIYDVLERAPGVVITRAQERIRPVVLDRAAARLLGVKAGTPAFQVERTTWSELRPVEWQQSLVRGDRYLYSIDLPRRREGPAPA